MRCVACSFPFLSMFLMAFLTCAFRSVGRERHWRWRKEREGTIRFRLLCWEWCFNPFSIFVSARWCFLSDGILLMYCARSVSRAERSIFRREYGMASILDISTIGASLLTHEVPSKSLTLATPNDVKIRQHVGRNTGDIKTGQQDK